MTFEDPAELHECSLPPEKDILFNFYPGSSYRDYLRRKLRRYFTVSESSMLARRFFKSKRAIDKERTRHLTSHFYIIHPYSVFRQYYDAFMVLGYLFILLFIPLHSCYFTFEEEKLLFHDHSFIVYVDISCIALCLADIIFNFFTGYVAHISKKLIVLSPSKIFIRYLFTFLLLDLVTLVPFEYLAYLYSSKVLWYCSKIRLLKLFRFFTFLKMFYQSAELFDLQQVYAQIICFCISTYLLIHIASGAYYFAALSDMAYNEESWGNKDQLQHFGLEARYLKTFVFTVATLLNVDYTYGAPHSNVDKIFIISESCLGSILFLVVVGKVMQWAYIFFESSRKYQEVENQLSAYMQYNKLPIFLQRRIKDYYEFRFQKSYYQESDILSILSTSLNEDVRMYSCRRLVQNISFFNDIPTAMLIRVVVCMKREIFLINDVILKAGSKGNTMYFITSGTVAIFSPSGKEVCHLEDGAHFGEVALVVEGARRVSSVVAIESCELQRLDRADFRRVVAPYPDLAARIERIAEQRLESSITTDEVYRRTFRPKKRGGKI